MNARAGLMLASAALTAVLGGCHADQKASGHGTVSGQILPGSVSDEMLPYDSIKSKAPLAPMQSVDRTDQEPVTTATDTAATPEPTMADSAGSPAPEAPAAPQN